MIKGDKEYLAKTAIRECRFHFLRAAAEHPQIRLGESLKERVFNPRQKLWADLGLPVPNKPALEWTTEQHLASETFDREYQRLIEAWAADHNLSYEWVHSAVHSTLAYDSFPTKAFPIVPGYQPPKFMWTSWYFGFESEKEYRKRIKADFQEALEAHIRAVRRVHMDFLPGRGSTDAHYRWAAERICLDWRWFKIAEQNGVLVTWQAVRKAVLPLLERIGIPARHNLR
jgi:hypothetical protein